MLSVKFFSILTRAHSLGRVGVLRRPLFLRLLFAADPFLIFCPHYGRASCAHDRGGGETVRPGLCLGHSSTAGGSGGEQVVRLWRQGVRLRSEIRQRARLLGGGWAPGESVPHSCCTSRACGGSSNSVFSSPGTSCFGIRGTKASVRLPHSRLQRLLLFRAVSHDPH